MSAKTKIKILLLVAALIVSTGFRCTCLSAKEKQALKSVNLTYWGVWDDPDNFSEIIAAYRLIHPNVNINYRKLRYEEFKKEILEAYAQNRPPDIISLHVYWLREYIAKDFISEMPKQVTMAYQKVESKMAGLKSDVIIEMRTKQTPTLGQIKNDYLGTVYNDIIINNKIYGLPLSVDTMVMYYNRDLLDNAGIALPPTNWQDFQEVVKKTTFTDREGNIIQAGVAMGTAKNVNRSVDILATLMMQNGATIIENGRVAFAGNQSDKTYNPGLEALIFYSDFANPTKEVYCWNKNMPDSLTAFASGHVAFYFGYSYDLPRILATSKGKINLGIAKMPQIQEGQEVNIANYWVETVSSRTKYKNEAWDFIVFAASAKMVDKYLNKGLKPTALRSLVNSQLKNDKLNAFASQILTARSWYTGKDADSAENYLKEMIEKVANGENPQNIMTITAQKVQQTIQ